MAQSKSHQNSAGQRLWRKGERAKVSILQTFRTSFEAGDALRATSGGQQDAEISARSRQRRDGVDDATLRAHLEADLNALLNTIQLGSTVDLDDVPHVRSSIVNYGFRDLSSVSVAELNTPQMRETIRRSLIDHEPRLVRESIDVAVSEAEGDSRQRLAISVSAELMGDPVDIPLDFDAEVDVAAGKLVMSKLRVQT